MLLSQKTVDIKQFHNEYRFKQKIGSGAFSDVFLAKHFESGKNVAIKILRITEDTSNAQAERRILRFKREMILNEKLEHPNIVSILDSGETENGVLFIVFEYVEGVSLANMIRKQGALPIRQTMLYMKQVLDGLSHAHDNGIIHRDLKPENIMIIQTVEPERVKILDFGISAFISKPWQNHTRITMTHEFLGTPSFAAPEQLRGDPVSTKTDIFSWGLMFLECLTGVSTYTDKSVAKVVHQQLSLTPIAIPLTIADHQLGVLLRWVLEKSPDRRAADSRYVLSRLESIVLEDIPETNGFLSENLPFNSGNNIDVAVYETASSSRERRQVTVLCFSINIEQRQNTFTQEIIDEIFNDIIDRCHEMIERFGGYIAGNIGDRIMAYFGFPDASDTDARRAIRAALELSSFMTRKSTILTERNDFKFTHYIGIHTGMVTVRTKVGENNSIIGLTPNLAGKLCSLAKPDSITISRNTFDLVKDIVECEPLDSMPSDIQSTFKSVLRIIGERRIDGLVGGVSARGIQLIGRKHELQIITRTLRDKSRQNKGTSYLIQGEAGIGKSRLAAEMGLEIQKQNGNWFEFRCTPETRNSALFPIFDFIDNNFGLHGIKDPDATYHLLDQKIRLLGLDSATILPVLASWLGLSIDSASLLKVSPQRQKEMLLQNMSRLLIALCKDTSDVIMFEDLHWADPTTLEFLTVFLGDIQKENIVLIMSARPEFIPVWNNRQVKIITLKRLNDDEIEQLILANIGKQTLSQEIVDKMVMRADGVPLFAEQLAQMALEQEHEKDTRDGITKKILAVDIPESLRDLLTGRLDRLGSAKKTIQIAATIGRVFNYDVISRVSLRDEASLLADLDQIVSAGMLHIRLRVGNPEYVFHHALVRDIAYDSLPHKGRNEIHLRIVQTLENDFKDIVNNQPQTIAHHCAGAGDYEKAVQYGCKATALSLSRSLYQEAISYALEAIEWAQKINDTSQQIIQELQLNQLLFGAYIPTQGFASDKVKKLIGRTEALSLQIPDDSSILFSTLWGMTIYYFSTPDYVKLEECMQKACTIADKFGMSGELAAITVIMGNRAFSSGSFDKAEELLLSGLKLYDPQNHRDHAFKFGHDTKIFGLSTLGLLYSARGMFKEAQKVINESIAWAKELKIPNVQAMAMSYQVGIYHYMNDKVKAKQLSEQLVTFIQENDTPIWMVPANLFAGWATNDLERAVQAVTFLSMMGSEQFASYWQSAIVQIEMHTGKYQDACKRLDTYITQAHDATEFFYLPELYRLKAMCGKLLSNSFTETIRSDIKESITLSKKMGARLFELRATIEWYLLSEDTNEKSSLKRTIKNIVSSFKDTDAIPDLKLALEIIGD